MTKLHTRVMTALAAGSLLLSTTTPIFAETTLMITGNGADTINQVAVQSAQTTTVTQSNATSVNNDINVKADTGGNEAEDNTGGDVSIDTGDTKVDVAIANQLNSNVAEVEPCNCDTDTKVEISGNVEGSENTANLKLGDVTQVTQYNVAKVNNEVDVDAKTGDNKANDNAGGEVKIDTGTATVKITASTVANMNTASIKPAGSHEGGSVTLMIMQNGQDTVNTINLELARLAGLSQTNFTSIDNDFDVYAETGDNEAEDNAGGSVEIDTGDVKITAEVDNMAGFNAAEMGCDCFLEDVTAKIAGNVEDSENTIKAALLTDSSASQFNYCGMYPEQPKGMLFMGGHHHRERPCFDNELELDGLTGDNKAEDNAGEWDDDPSIDTGNVDTTVKVENIGGSNVFGDIEMPEFEWPTSGMGLDLSISFDLSDLLAWFEAQMA